MQLLAVGHKRTGACPTFDRPVIQRDGLLLRIPLVGGALTGAQAALVAEAAASCGSGAVELTNRGNLQLRGIREGRLAAAQGAIRSIGSGDRGAALVTISPFAGAAAHQLRAGVLAALETESEGLALSPKFAAHVDDAAGWTAGRRAEAVLALRNDDVALRVRGLDEVCTDAASAVAVVRALADACRQVGEQARVADVIESIGRARLAAGLPIAASDWQPPGPAPSPFDGVGPLGPVVGPDGRAVTVAAAPLGRIDAEVLGALGELAGGSGLRVTPWRSVAVDAPAHRLAALGLIVDRADPAAGVVSCVGAAGCWQTEADALAEAERQIARRAEGAGPALGGGVLHVSGCDKRCATRGPVAVTLIGRTDGSGFDEVVTAAVPA